MVPNAYSPLWFRLFMPLQTEEWTQAAVAFLARQVPLPRYQRVLDLCCGYGRHALGLSALGYHVTGLDRDATALAEAERRARAAHRDITFFLADMREVGALPETYDAVINMWQSLSYFDEETNADLLRQIHSRLTPGGRFIVDLYNRAYYDGHQGETRQEIDGTIVESRGYMQGNRWHAELTYRDQHGRVIGGDHMEWQLYTPDEFLALAAACGFTSRCVCAWSDEHRAPAPDIARMQIVLERDDTVRAPTP